MTTYPESLLKMNDSLISVHSSLIRAETLKAKNYIGSLPLYKQYIASLRDLLQEAVNFNLRFPQSPFEIPPIAQQLVNALLTAADIVQASGDRQAAQTLRIEALSVSGAHLGRKGKAHAERSRAGSLLTEGRFNEAIVALMCARDVLLQEGNLVDLARVTIDLTELFIWLGDLPRAKTEIQHAEALIGAELAGKKATQTEVRKDFSASVSAIMAGHGDLTATQRSMELYRASTEIVLFHGFIAKGLKEWEEAERCFERVLPEYQSFGVGESIEFQLAQIKIGQLQFSEASAQLRKIQNVFDQDKFRPKRAALQWLQSKALHATGDSKEALPLVHAGIEDLTSRHFDPYVLWNSQWLRAQIYRTLGNHQLALESLRDALETISSLRRAPLGYRLDSTYLEDKKDFYADGISESVQANAPELCCRFIENIKSRTLTAVLSVPTSDKTATTDFEREFNDVTQQLDAIEYQAYRNGWNELKLKHRDLLKKRADLIERIRVSDPRWHNLSEPLEIDFEKLLRALTKRSQAALTLYYQAPDLTAVLLNNGEITASQMKISDSSAKAVADYAEYLQRKTSFDFDKHDLSTTSSVLAEHLIPDTLLSDALSAASLIVVPHGILHLVSWSGLLYKGRRLFEYLPVGILPNLNILSLESNISRPRKVALVGVSGSLGQGFEELPSARGEIEDIASIYQGSAYVMDPLVDGDATESAFWKMVRSLDGAGNILHMSCHGMISVDEPMNSGLLLSDSKVDAAELSRTRLPFDEIVLSACSTGWRPHKVRDVMLNADEILGIPAGILESGVSAVIVSIPKAEGKSARAFTRQYHQRRAAGDPPLVAFQGAQKHLLGSDYVPGSWLGFTLYGCV